MIRNITKNIWGHWTNENRDKNDRVVGSGFWAGRAWLHFGHESGWNKEKSLHIEWYFGKHAHHTMLEMHTSFVMEKELFFAIGIGWLFSLYFGITLPVFPNWRSDRSSGIRVFDGAIWIDIWTDPHEWRSKDPFWKKTICIHPADILLGKKQHSETAASEHHLTVQMPEGEYPAQIKMTNVVLKRPRWPFATKFFRAHIEMGKPIPFPGKGENSWDIGDDAVFSMTCAVATPEEAAQRLVESVMRDRERNGGPEWLPES